MGKSKGYRCRTRRLLAKKPREHGKLRLSKLLHEYTPGNQVVVMIDSSVHKGMPHKRFQGRIGTIVSKRGRSYMISISQGNTVKEIIARPEHLEPYNGG
jgi:large subunit ribosomal protein L21e